MRKYTDKEREEVFWSKVSKEEDGCWIWTSRVNNWGYGEIRVGKRKIKVHRYSYELHYKNLDPNLCVCHKCDNTRCVNPEHLFLGTQQDNTIDKVKKGRQAHNFGNKNAKQKLNDKQVQEIRILAKQLTQKELAQKYNVCRPLINMIINHKRRYNVESLNE